MIVKITYDDKRLDVFDTSTFTQAMPLGKQNMLTNFEVRFDDMAFDGLWLTAHSYLADDAFKREAANEEVPVARRTKGWRFLLASSEELDHVELVVVDGEAIMKRVFGELVDLQAFDEAAYACIGSSSKGLHGPIAELYGYLKRMTGEPNPKVPGISRDVVDAVISSVAAESKVREKEEDEQAEEWGDMDEAGW